MTRLTPSRFAGLTALLLSATSLGACGNTFSRLASVGEEPAVTPVQNPAERQAHVQMPMPTPVAAERAPNSLWRQGARGFFKDNRASQVGDIVTVTIDRTDTAELSNSSARTRTNSNSAAAPNLLGYEANLWNRLPGTQAVVDPAANLFEVGSNLSNNGTGTISRTEELDLKIAAVVTQVLPNGNLVIHGRQEIRVNFETRVIQVGGVVRPADIRTNVSGTAGANDNEIAFERIAEARLTYGGRGQLSDVQQPRWGDQILDIIFPF